MKIFELPDNWNEILYPQTPLIELALRGFVLYFFIIFMLRILARRTTGEIAAMDLVFILLVTEVASNSLGDYTSITDGIILLVIIMIINFSINKLGFHSKFFRNLFNHSPVQIIHNGKIIKKNIEKELLTKDELLSNMREHGIEKIEDVKKAYVESEGNITFITFEKEKETE